MLQRRTASLCSTACDIVFKFTWCKVLEKRYNINDKNNAYVTATVFFTGHVNLKLYWNCTLLQYPYCVLRKVLSTQRF